MGTDEVFYHFRQIVFFRQFQSVRHVTDYHLCTLLVAKIFMRIDTSWLVFSKEYRIFHFSDVVVPSPNVAEDHQTKNALALVDKEAAIYVKDADAMKHLIPVALETVADAQKLKTLSENIAKLALPDSATIIAKEVLKLIDKL